MTIKRAAPIGTYAHHERHWHYVRKRRVQTAGRTAKEILAGQLITIFGAVLAGVMLDLTKDGMATMAGVFMIMPGVFDLGGSVAGAMAARLSHRLDENTPVKHVVRDSLIHAFTLVCFAAVFLGIFGGILSWLLFNADFWRILMTTFISAMIAATVGFPIIASSTLLARKNGLDADNFIGPIETSLFDTLTVLAITITVAVIK